MTYAMHGDGVDPDGTPPPGHPDHPSHGGEEYVIRVAWHRDGTVCVSLEHPEYRTEEEARQVLSMVGELAEVPGALSVGPSGNLVVRHG